MENIEAMLCAYIEGDLDPAGRAEIEKHLQANPHHQKLIRELTATRDLVRNLPRVHAPADVGESLRGQVERSILLDDAAPSAAEARLRIHRWPQIAAVAAVFVLTAALGIVVFRMVMPTFKSPQFTQLAPVQAQKQSPPAEEQPEPKADERTAAPLPAMTAPAVSNIATRPAETVANTVDFDAINNRLRNSGFAPAPKESPQPAPVYLVINTPNPSIGSEKLTQFLSSNNIAWSPIPEAGPANAPSTMPAPDQSANGDANPPRPSSVASRAMSTRFAGDAAPESKAATQPQDQNPTRPNSALDVSPNALPQRTANAQQPLQNAANSTQNVYLARRLTPRQAVDLRNALSDQVGPLVFDSADKSAAPSATQPSPQPDMIGAAMSLPSASEAKNKEDAKDSTLKSPPATQPAPAIAPGDLLLVHATNLTLPEGPEQVQSLHVGEDGKLSLPGLPPVEAANQTNQQIQEALAKAYASANQGPGCQVTIRNLSTPNHPPTTEPSTDIVIVLQTPAPPPTTQPN